MDFIINEAEVSEYSYSENSDCSDDETQLDNHFVNDNISDTESATFYRKIDKDKTYEPKFRNRTKTYEEAVNEEDEPPYYGEDGQPEMYAPEVIEHVEFHYFTDYKKNMIVLSRHCYVSLLRLNLICYFLQLYMGFVI